MREDDARIIAGRGQILQVVGGDAEMLLAASRYFGDNLRRAAESQVRFFSGARNRPFACRRHSAR